MDSNPAAASRRAVSAAAWKEEGEAVRNSAKSARWSAREVIDSFKQGREV
jgi:hypothetical protein